MGIEQVQFCNAAANGAGLALQGIGDFFHEPARSGVTRPTYGW
jgi:hypothetical protein